MITRTTGFKVGEKLFATIEEAQRAFLVDLTEASNKVVGDTETNLPINRTADFILAHQGAILDVLTTGPKSKPRARSINGGKRIRKAKVTLSEAVAKHSPPETA